MGTSAREPALSNQTDPSRARHLLAVHGDRHALWAHRQGTGQLHPSPWLEAPSRPDPRGQGAPSPLRRPRLLEPRASGACHPRREPGLRRPIALQQWASTFGREPSDRPGNGSASLPSMWPRAAAAAPGRRRARSQSSAASRATWARWRSSRPGAPDTPHRPGANPPGAGNLLAVHRTG